MGRAINLVKKDTETEEVNAGLEESIKQFGTVNFEGEEYDIIKKDGDWVYLRSIHDTQIGRKEIKVKEKDITINEGGFAKLSQTQFKLRTAIKDQEK